MLSHQDNETLVRVGPETPIGTLFRLFWIPFIFSKDLVADSQPKRVMLLTEDLVAFRDSQGRVGLMANACAHRGAPMMFGRNEDCGLRCVYHGWKYDVTGAVTDMPAEPAKSRRKDKVWRNGFRHISRLSENVFLNEFEWAERLCSARALETFFHRSLRRANLP